VLLDSVVDRAAHDRVARRAALVALQDGYALLQPMQLLSLLALLLHDKEKHNSQAEQGNGTENYQGSSNHEATVGAHRYN
jgi:hypothetical protein